MFRPEGLLPIENDPVRRVLPGAREDLLHRPVSFPEPGVVPSISHVAIYGILDSELPESIHEAPEGQTTSAVNDAELSPNLAECPVLVCSVGLEAAFELFPIEKEHALAETHSSFFSNRLKWLHRVLMAEVVEVPSSSGTPGEDPVVRAALETLMILTTRDVVPCHIAVTELLESLPRKCCSTDEDDILIILRGHLSSNEVDTSEIRVVDGQAVVALNTDRFHLLGFVSFRLRTCPHMEEGESKEGQNDMDNTFHCLLMRNAITVPGSVPCKITAFKRTVSSFARWRSDTRESYCYNKKAREDYVSSLASSELC